MFEKLVLENFQKYEKKVLDLSSPITLLVGATEAGKSTILRALRWVCLNRPIGVEELIRWGEDRCSVRLFLDGGKQILRSSGPGGNLYNLNERPEPYAAVGFGVPPDIENLLNLSPASFALQIDPPYLFTASPGEVSKELNSIVNLGLIDSTLKHLSQDLKKTKTRVEVCKERLGQAREERDGLLWVEEAEAAFARLEIGQKEILDLRRKRGQGASLLRDRAKYLKEYRDASTGLLHVRKALSHGIRAAKLKAKWERGEVLLAELIKLDRILRVPEEQIRKLLSLCGRVERITKKRKQAEALLAERQKLSDELWDLRTSVTRTKKQLGELVGSSCPLCGEPTRSSPSASPTSTGKKNPPSSAPRSRTG